jgi:hypothetical protein
VAGDQVAAILAVFFSRQESYLFFKDTIKVKIAFYLLLPTCLNQKLVKKCSGGG